MILSPICLFHLKAIQKNKQGGSDFIFCFCITCSVYKWISLIAPLLTALLASPHQTLLTSHLQPMDCYHGDGQPSERRSHCFTWIFSLFIVLGGLQCQIFKCTSQGTVTHHKHFHRGLNVVRLEKEFIFSLWQDYFDIKRRALICFLAGT